MTQRFDDVNQKLEQVLAALHPDGARGQGLEGQGRRGVLADGKGKSTGGEVEFEAGEGEGGGGNIRQRSAVRNGLDTRVEGEGGCDDGKAMEAVASDMQAREEEVLKSFAGPVLDKLEQLMRDVDDRLSSRKKRTSRRTEADTRSSANGFSTTGRNEAQSYNLLENGDNGRGGISPYKLQVSIALDNRIILVLCILLLFFLLLLTLLLVFLVSPILLLRLTRSLALSLPHLPSSHCTTLPAVGLGGAASPPSPSKFI